MITFTLLLVAGLAPVTLAQQVEGDGFSSLFLNMFGMLPPYSSCVIAPQVCPNDKILYWLYTSDAPDSPQILDVSNLESLQNAKFMKGRPVKFLFHGYTGHRDFAPNTEIRPAYLKNMDVNVISIDYGALVRDPCYVWARVNSKVVGNCTAQLIDTLVSLKKAPLSDFHLIGFSLGAHVAGYTSNYLKSGKLERITGLDPALPLFVGLPETMLDASDARHVDVIHTDAGQRGKVAEIGQVDFYVNDGSNQPGCETLGQNEASSCSHNRAPTVFAESVTSKEGFWGIRCSSYQAYFKGQCRKWDGKSPMALMGEYTDPRASGVYFVETNKKPPYAAGKKFV